MSPLCPSLLLTAALACAAGAQLPPIIPQPREVTLEEGLLELARPATIVAEGVEAPAALEILQATLGIGDDGTPVTLDLVEDPQLGPEGYELTIEGAGISLRAPSDAGLFYGAHTLRQIVEGAGESLPCCHIRDWPAMRWRGISYPVTDSADIRRVAGMKLNLIVWEVSGLFRSPSHPELPGEMPLERIAEICAEARRNHVALLPHIQCFGHAHWLLIPHPEMRADPESTHTINPFAPGVYELIGDLIGELVPASGEPWFFPGCDEPVHIDAWCRSQGLDPAEVVGDHIARLAELARVHGARIIVWGDYFLKYPEALSRFSPEDVVIADWHYEAVEEFPSVDVFVNAGFDTLVAPSAAPGEPLFPDYAVTTVNIANLLAEGHRRGAEGMINTNWPTGPMPLTALWYGWALGAEAAWSPEPVDREAFEGLYFSQAFGADAEAAADLWFDWAGANAGWSRAPAPVWPRILETLALAGTVGAHGLPTGQGTEMTRRQIERADRLRAEAADPDLVGWRDLEVIGASIGRSMALQSRGALVLQAYSHLLEGCLQAARGRMEQARDLALQDEPAAAEALTAALERLAEARPVGPADPAAILGFEPIDGPGAVDIDVVACHRAPDGTKAAPIPHGLTGIIMFDRGTPVEIGFRVTQPGEFALWALLRHSAGEWADGRFVRGGRNAAYEGHYAFRLDELPLVETWVGDELNPEDDEALRWALLYEGPLEAGDHTLHVRCDDIRFSVVERFVVTNDADWDPEG